MQWCKRICLAFLGLAVLLQLPFAYNRYKTARLAEAIADLNDRRIVSVDSGYIDYKGVIHVHSFIGGHSTGTFEELIAAATANELDFVVMTEHVSHKFNTAGKTLNGEYEKVLWIGGNEVSTADGNRFLVFDGYDGISRLGGSTTREFLDRMRSGGRRAYIAYPEKFRSGSGKADGIEVFSLNTNARRMNPLTFLLDAAWSYRAYPELTLARYFERPTGALELYDFHTTSGRPVLFAGNDAHSNLGYHIGDDANNKFINFKFDRYETIFRLLRTHVLLPEDVAFSKESLLSAFENGNSYVGFDVLADSSGFVFFSEDASGRKIMGEEVPLAESSLILRSAAPLPARFILFRDGKQVFQSKTVSEIEYAPGSKGAYRVEVYLDSLGAPFDSTPWIMSNPIYIR